MPEPEIMGASVVLLGSFNPAIFHPQWFASQNLLPKGEAESATIKVVVPAVCEFETERFQIQVVQERFMAISKPGANSEPLRDLLVGTFFILEHTPVTAMGLNHHLHFQMKTEADWHRIGDRLAPKDGWNGVLHGRPGMLSLTITTEAADSHPKTTVRVEPSVKLKSGVYFDINEHYPFEKDDKLRKIMAVLQERWKEADLHAKNIANHIIEWAGK